MATHILGQCKHMRLSEVEHLMSVLEHPEQLDTTTLTNSQRFAFHLIALAGRIGISFQLMREVVREALFWGDKDRVTYIQVKFLRHADINKVREFKRLWKEGG